ncbi:hypothetical protein L486_03974 [Kwoniella mangroviensis CBS 10435]|uniref:C2H2-type domain-containing protein n=1 Tax=Kwoniella mangroviensis CBS 10435 TaxID=1331196 RepID=A0A1B9IR87_9TREE|nr:hypothetical protein L486_03974 [Kwoniella mangroviensis CBS 10435]
MSSALSYDRDPTEGLIAFHAESVKAAFATRTTQERPTMSEVSSGDDEEDSTDLLQALISRQTCGLKRASQRTLRYREFNEIRDRQERKRGQIFDSKDGDQMVFLASKLLEKLILRSKKAHVDEEGTEVVEYMKVQSITNMAKDIIEIVPRMEWGFFVDDSLMKGFRRGINTAISHLVEKYQLRSDMKEKVALFCEDIGMMVSSTLRYSKHGDVALQHVVLLLLLLHTGGRPSTFMPSSDSGFFFKWSDIVWIARRDDKEENIMGWDVVLTLRHFKRSQRTSIRSLRLYIRTVRRKPNLIFDLGCALLAHGLRQGVFGPERSIEDIYQSRLLELCVEPEFANRPVLLGGGSGGFGLDTTAPLRVEGASIRFKENLEDCGYQAAESEILGMSSVRRGTATRWVDKFGRMATRLLLGHAPGSFTLEKNYDGAIEVLDLVKAVLRAELSETNVVNPILDSLLSEDPKLKLFTESLAILSECLVDGSSDWMRVPPYIDITDLRENQLDEMLGRTRRAIRNRVASLHGEARRQAKSKEGKRRKELTIDDKIRNASSYKKEVEELPTELIREFANSCREALFDDEEEESLEDEDGAADEELLVLDDNDLTMDGNGRLDISMSNGIALSRLTSGSYDSPSDNEGIVESNGSILSDFRDLQKDKKAWISALVGLEGHRDHARDRVLCSQCQSDDYTPAEFVGKTWLPYELRRHEISFHVPGAVTGRWLDAHLYQMDGENTEKYHCAVDSCDKSYVSTRELRRHMVRDHTDQLGQDIPVRHFRTMIHQDLDAPEPYCSIARERLTILESYLASNAYEQGERFIRSAQKVDGRGRSMIDLENRLRREAMAGVLEEEDIEFYNIGQQFG